MKIKLNDPPRTFKVGVGEAIQMKDCGYLAMEPNEQVTFTTESGAEYDVARKDWGFYATPSLNGRLEHFGLRAVLVKNRHNHYYIMLVERGKESLFEQYVDLEGLTVIYWMDSLTRLERLEEKIKEIVHEG